MESFNSKDTCSKVNALLKTLIPANQQLCTSDLQQPNDQQNPAIHQFLNTLIRVSELVKRCESISAFNVFHRCRYASQILKLEEDINGVMGSIPEHVELDARTLIAVMKDLYKELKPPDLSRTLNTTVQPQMSLGNLCQSTEREDPNKWSNLSHFPVKSRFYAGLEKPVADLKELLFQSEVSVVGVHGMGGGGKTTLALAICNDPHIKGYFENVHFVSVSQSSNLKGIVETMWNKNVGRKKPEFQNVEDARLQLQQQLFTKSKRTLMILDDVWSRDHLEKLLFETPAYKIVVTTRDSSIIPRNSCTRLYQLPLLGHEDALSLFCFSVFGQTSIPSNADVNLVMEVQAECKGLPLALKVIGSSLNAEPHVTWLKANNKLALGVPISSDHEGGLFRCLETSIDFLDDAGRECFLDLALFLENKKICADALLDIWVYVWKYLEQVKVIQDLEKLSLSLCEGFGNISTFTNTNLREFNLDHCSDLVEWPADICHMPSAQIWSITNCHLVEKLPYGIGNLSSLRILRLSALPSLKELPASIGKLEKLEFLDISLCERLKELPQEIGLLKHLKTFDMRECSRLRRLPRSVCELSFLKHVICDEKIGHQWLQMKILDDVWSRDHLEKLLFERPAYKIVVTTRDSSIIPRNSCSRLYQLPLLGHEDAVSLFCFSAFGQTSIPSNADVNLVMEVQAECKGLPLALKVIGSSLNAEPHVTWLKTNNKLALGEPISSDHEGGLFRCLETSTDFLDDDGRECFLDLALFLENKKICADALLDIWVYVRKYLEQVKVIQDLEKLSLSLYEGFGNISTFNNTNLREFNLDHCSDLVEWPADICPMPSAQIWSITNCHLVEKLPYDIGNLSSLRMLRLSALPSLKELPASIGKLEKLEF